MRFTLALMILLLAFVLPATGCAPADTGGDDIDDDRQPVTGPAEFEQPDEPIGGSGPSGGEVPVETSPDDETDGETAIPVDPTLDSGIMTTIGFPDGWPEEVGVPPGFTATTSIRHSETSLSVSAEGFASVDEAGEFYMEIEGWERLGETNSGGEGSQAPLMKAVRFMKDDLMLDIMIIAEEGITKMHLNLNEMPVE